MRDSKCRTACCSRPAAHRSCSTAHLLVAVGARPLRAHAEQLLSAGSQQCCRICLALACRLGRLCQRLQRGVRWRMCQHERVLPAHMMARYACIAMWDGNVRPAWKRYVQGGMCVPCPPRYSHGRAHLALDEHIEPSCGGKQQRGTAVGSSTSAWHGMAGLGWAQHGMAWCNMSRAGLRNGTAWHGMAGRRVPWQATDGTRSSTLPPSPNSSCGSERGERSVLPPGLT